MAAPFGTTVRRARDKCVCTGYDGRLSSPDLEAAVVQGRQRCREEAELRRVYDALAADFLNAQERLPAMDKTLAYNESRDWRPDAPPWVACVGRQPDAHCRHWARAQVGHLHL